MTSKLPIIPNVDITQSLNKKIELESSWKIKGNVSNNVSYQLGKVLYNDNYCRQSELGGANNEPTR